MIDRSITQLFHIHLFRVTFAYLFFILENKQRIRTHEHLIRHTVSWGKKNVIHKLVSHVFRG